MQNRNPNPMDSHFSWLGYIPTQKDGAKYTWVQKSQFSNTISLYFENDTK